MYRIEYSKDAIKFFEKHKKDSISLKIAKAIETVALNPYNKDLDVKQMSNNKKSLYRLRVWKYRIIYQLYNEELMIFCVDIWARGGIYNNLK